MINSKPALSAVVALSALIGCGAPNRSDGTSPTGGTTGTGGGPASGGSGGDSGGTGSGGIVSSGGAGGQGGSGGTTAATAAGGAGGATGLGGSTGSGGGTGSGGSTARGGATGSGGATNSGGATGAGGATGSGGTTGSAGAMGRGGATGSGGTTGSAGATGSGGATSSGGTAGSTGTGPQEPCDIYAAAGTPCAAAHSTVRALYAAYSGPLYQVRKSGGTQDIPVLAPGGFVDISKQDSFCNGTTCTISIIYDQSPNKNDLTKSPAALWLPNGGNEAKATDGKITVGGHTAYGIYVNGSSTNVAYRNNATKGLAKGDAAEAMYMVVDGTRYSQWCCFDYGNAESDGKDDGNATMECLYFGNSTQYGSHGAGSGPWLLADLENGMFAGDSGSETTPVPGNTSITGWSYVTAILKGPSGNSFGLKAGNAQSGTLQTKWNGGRPPNYSPKKLQGSIILGTGGDGSNNGVGTFFEGAITSGNPPDATDDLVQANVVAAGYGK